MQQHIGGTREYHHVQEKDILQEAHRRYHHVPACGEFDKQVYESLLYTPDHEKSSDQYIT